MNVILINIPIIKQMIMKNVRKQFRKIPYLVLLMLFCVVAAYSQSGITLKGTVTDTHGEPVIGASVSVKGDPTKGTMTDVDGAFSLSVANDKATLVVTYIGMTTKEVRIAGSRTFKIVLEEDNKILNEVIVVGFGQQKKQSVVGAISQASGKVLERTGGVSSLGSALTGNIPGLITTTTTGMPGEENPNLVIRAQTTWNNSAPLILVDGIERPMSDVDINSVESISVLKDASATAVFGVKGANGVILITTKRGQDGKARIDIGANMTLKSVSKLPNKYDVYDALMLKNKIVEYELAATGSSGSWAYINPQEYIENFRNQTTQEQRERYPNIDWSDYLFKDFAMSYNANINISGGTKFVKYFSSVDYTHEGDLFKSFNSGQGYAY
jgi:TonB-linked SusC/RagA family outer membrane protein